MAVSDARMGVTLQGSRPLSNEENRAWEAEAQRASGAFLTVCARTALAADTRSSCLPHSCLLRNSISISPHPPASLSRPDPATPSLSVYSSDSILPQAKGIDLGQIQVMFHVHVCTGLVRHPDGSLQKKFSDKEELFPVQVTLRKLPGRPDLRFAEQPAGSAPPLPPGSTAVFLGVSYFGARTEIVEGALITSCKRAAQSIACSHTCYHIPSYSIPPSHLLSTLPHLSDSVFNVPSLLSPLPPPRRSVQGRDVPHPGLPVPAGPRHRPEAPLQHGDALREERGSREEAQASPSLSLLALNSFLFTVASG